VAASRLVAFRAAAVALAFTAGCASTDVDVPTFRAPAREVLDYLLPPGTGLGGQATGEARAALDRGYSSLVRGDVAAARRVAVEVLATAPGLPSAQILEAQLLEAQVLEAQAEFVEGRVESATSRLLAVVTRAPGALAAQLLLGRCAELSGDPVTAFVSYAAVDVEVADRRRESLREVALQSAFGQVSEALRRGRVDRAEEWRDWLVSWGEGSPLTLRASLAITEATGDAQGALEALRELERLGLDERPLRQRLAELESERGDPQVAIGLYDEMLARSPGDRSLEDGLAAARFRFRMQMLPQGVGDAVARSEVTRGEFASLLYWLVPGVRGSRSLSGVIVTDVPEDAERRQEIVRVVNLGLMDLANPALRAFEPSRPILRGAALASLLRVPEHLGARLACTAPIERTPRPSSERVCEVAASCGLIPLAAECLPGAPASGADASNWLRRILELL
jgi:tetratricopeptide (TPR) repeat protein